MRLVMDDRGVQVFSTFGLFCLDSVENYTIVLLITAVVLLVTYLQRTTFESVPPVCKGWIPWLGCAIQFGRNPLYFIEEKRKELGPIFSLHVAGERMTFLTEHDDFHHFYDSPNVDFQECVKDAVSKVALVDKHSFFKYHTVSHDLVKGRLAASRLGDVVGPLCDEFNIHIDSFVQHKERLDLMDVVQHSMYAGVINNVCGRGRLPVACKVEFEKLFRLFRQYDEQLEYGSKLPRMFLGQWANAQTSLLNMFRDIVNKIRAEKPTSESKILLDSLIAQINDDSAPNFCLMLFWASLANAIPMTFWTLCYILKHEHVQRRLRRELHDVFGDRCTGGPIRIEQEDLKKVPYLKWCILEAVRVNSVGVIARRVTKQFTLKGFTIKAGTMLMLSPYWAHKNPKYFPEPHVYKPERWEGTNPDKGVFMEGFSAFGGGRYQCPGRWFAMLEMQMYIALFLLKFDSTVHNDIPPVSMKHIVGTQHAEGKFYITCSRRQYGNQS